MNDHHDRSDRALGVGCPISRRDFVGGTLVGSGAALLAGGPAGAAAPGGRFGPSGSAWTGFGGVGDYAWSNGNTAAVRDAAHHVRDGVFDAPAVMTAEETFDVVVVGGGFTGMGAAYRFSRNAAPGQKLLVLENHPVPGGEAKQNEMDVNGHRVIGPQGSNGAAIPAAGSTALYAEIWNRLGLPAHEMAYVPLGGGAEKYHLASDHYAPMLEEQAFPTGYFFSGKGWARDPISQGFRNTPWSPAAQQELDDLVHNRRQAPPTGGDIDRWLDSISYQDLLEQAGYGKAAIDYLNPLLGVGNFGVCANAVSALAVRGLRLPATVPSGTPPMKTGSWFSFPGGNAAMMRGMLRLMIPDVLGGRADFASLVSAPLNFAALDRPENPVRIRVSSTVVRVEHDGAPESAGSVLVTYVRDGKIHRVRAKSVVMGIGGWIARRIVRDLPERHVRAYGRMLYGPVLTINVAVTNWRFIERLGVTNMRWFGGLGWHLTVRRNVTFDAAPAPFTPDSPTMLTFYTPVLMPDAPPAAQGAMARQKLLDTPYLDYERQVRRQMTELFGATGFDARRDIAGIVLNRWGHAYSAPQPGFFHGTDGDPGTPQVLRRPHGRITFAHSEFAGRMNMISALNEGERAVRQALELV